MIDIHSHIIPGIDDGCENLSESLDLIIKLKELGFTKLVLTPHYIENSNYCLNNKSKIKEFNSLKKHIKEKNIDIDLYLGNEIYINFEIINLIKKNEVYPINNTKYLLIEFPLYNEINNIEDHLYDLKVKGYIPIIAHPERYRYFQKNYKKMVELYKNGILFQVNYGSILGYYGNEAKKLIKYALKNNMASFIATDIHKVNSPLLNTFDKAVNKIKKITGEEKFKEITEINPLKVIENKEIEND